MAKKSYQSAAKYARQSQRSKKKRPSKSGPHESVNVASQPRNVPEAVPARAVPQLVKNDHTGTSAATSAHAYVVSDLRRTGIIAIAIFAILIILVVTLG